MPHNEPGVDKIIPVRMKQLLQTDKDKDEDEDEDEDEDKDEDFTAILLQIKSREHPPGKDKLFGKIGKTLANSRMRNIGHHVRIILSFKAASKSVKYDVAGTGEALQVILKGFPYEHLHAYPDWTDDMKNLLLGVPSVLQDLDPDSTLHIKRMMAISDESYVSPKDRSQLPKKEVKGSKTKAASTNLALSPKAAQVNTVKGSKTNAASTNLALSPKAAQVTTEVASSQKVLPLKAKKEVSKRKQKDLPSTSSSSSTKKPKRDASDSDFVAEED
jgi:hypothetical protein